MVQPSTDRLTLLYRISQAFNSSLDMDEVLNRVIDEVIAITRAERGFLMLREENGRLGFRVARGMDQQTIESPEFHISRGVVEQVVREGQPLLADNAQDDAFLSRRASIIGLGLRSILCVPLQLKGQIQGIIYVDNRLQAGIFASADLELLSSIAASAAIAIENARLYQLAIEKGRMERELQVAREVQTSLLPQEIPQIAGWDLAAWWQPARQVSGDYYDFVPVEMQPDLSEGGAGISEPSAWGIIVADVSDKGMPAALFMALSRSTVRASVAQALSPAAGITKANHLIYADAADGMFVTLFYILIHPLTGVVTYVNAGHDPPLLYQVEGALLVDLERTGLVLGVDNEVIFEQRTMSLRSGDFIVLYTDGVTDAENNQGQAFGRERLRRLIREQRGASAADVVAALEQTLRAFVGARESFDDITVVVIKRQ